VSVQHPHSASGHRSEDGFGITTDLKIALPKVSRRTNVVKRDFDLIVYGATGYTGRLIAEYLTTSYRGDDAPSWVIAGRSTDKLRKVRADIGAPDDLPLLKADAAELASLRSMSERAAVIITTVGPYQLHGSELVAACAATGTAYDAEGPILWIWLWVPRLRLMRLTTWSGTSPNLVGLIFPTTFALHVVVSETSLNSLSVLALPYVGQRNDH